MAERAYGIVAHPYILILERTYQERHGLCIFHMSKCTCGGDPHQRRLVVQPIRKRRKRARMFKKRQVLDRRAPYAIIWVMAAFEHHMNIFWIAKVANNL